MSWYASRIPLRIASIFLTFIIILGFIITPLQIGSVNAQDGGDLRISTHRETGKVNFIGADPGKEFLLSEAVQLGLVASDRAMIYLDHFGPMLGLEDARRELQEIDRSIIRDGKRVSQRYQQVFRGIPVLAGELIINLNDQGGLLAISGEISPGISLDTTPVISKQEAADTAVGVVSKGQGIDASDLSASVPQLWIYDARLLRPSARPVELVWRMEVDSTINTPINELVLINAHDGGVSLHFNQVDTYWSNLAAASEKEIPVSPADAQPSGSEPERAMPASPALLPVGLWSTYTANNTTTLPGTFLCNEGTEPCTGGADLHADAAHNYAGDAYNFYLSHHTRDSLDNANMRIISSVHYDVGYNNAFWSGSAQQIVYGDGAAYPTADDVVGHELTHGVTDFESNLFYYYQSGAINESFSDVWGEFIDLTNGDGNDLPAVRWEIGEDIAGRGAIRDMENPPTFEDPDKMTSEYYYVGSTDYDDFGDYGGVHTNNGVNNKAAYLMTDGGSFNGQTVTGLGIDKVAAIYYEVQTNLLTSGADYLDLYNALYQSCVTLIGGPEGITAGDCQEVRKATDAVEMDLEPVADYNPEADVCAAGITPNLLFYDDFEGGVAHWTFGAVSGTSSWVWTSGYANSGELSIRGDDQQISSDAFAALANDVVLPDGSQPYLHFNHAFGFEDPDYDGGWLEYSINNGTTWLDASPFYDSGLDYTGLINTATGGGDNTHTGRAAFVGDSHGYVSTRYDLNPIVGENVRFRWRMSVDSSINDRGWFIDDVRVYTCNTIFPSSDVTTRVSLATDGTEGNSGSFTPAISADGRYVAFRSEASNLVSGDTNGRGDIFVHDTQTGTTTRVSLATDGTEGNSGSFSPAISADGRYVAFHSNASNLVSGDTNGAYDVFVHDTQTGTTTRVSLATDGTEGNNESSVPAISADGRYVAFRSFSSNLVSGDTNGRGDIFVHDTQTGTTTRVSLATDGTEGNSSSVSPDISADGRYVAFHSWASNLVSGDTNNQIDTFVHDTQTCTTTRVSLATDGTQGNLSSGYSAISADGRYVAFHSDASNLVSGDTNGCGDIFVHDTQTGTTTRVSLATDGAQGNRGSASFFTPAISADGRYAAFESDAYNLVSGDTNNQIDIFVHDTQTGTTTRVSLATDGTEGKDDGSYYPSISADGRYVAFFSYASNLVSGDTNGTWDIFVHENDYEIVPSLANNFATGASGSYFTFTGTDFPANDTVTITVNGQELGTVPTNTNGELVFLFSTTNADDGAYFVTASVNPSATTRFTLDSNEPVHPQDGTGTVFEVPAGIAFTETIYLPLVLK